MALTESREMETQMRWKAGGFNERKVVYLPRLEERPSPTEDAIAQKRIGIARLCGCLHSGKYNGGGAVRGLTSEPRLLRHLLQGSRLRSRPYLDLGTEL